MNEILEEKGNLMVGLALIMCYAALMLIYLPFLPYLLWTRVKVRWMK